jgi:hypothetical protein
MKENEIRLRNFSEKQLEYLITTAIKIIPNVGMWI